MDCYSEKDLERAAVMALDLGIRLDTPIRVCALSLILPEGELRCILTHAQSCVRCGQLLAILQATELSLRSELASETAPGEPTRMTPEHVALEPIPFRWVGSRRPEPSETRAPYALAADTEGPAVGESPVLSLGSSDGRFLVRIFPRARGEGATAVLLRADAPGRAAPSAALARVAIEVEGTEYVFDENGIAELPRFPAQAVSLVVR